MALSFRRERETKNTVRFSEDGDEAEQAIGTTSRRGSQIWRLRQPETHWGAGGRGPRLRPLAHSGSATVTST